MIEVWKDIKGYKGLYQVSNLGRVKSLSRFSSIGRRLKEKILKPSVNGGGYLSIALHKNEKQKSKRVHVLVAQAFLNHTPNGYEGLIVDHVDNNPLNNRVDNLQLTTARHNASKDKKNKTSKYTGVCWSKQREKWRAYIRVACKLQNLGSFNCETAASIAYQKELNKINK